MTPTKQLKCPNCGARAYLHIHNGCALAVLGEVAHSRGGLTRADVARLIAEANMDTMWSDIGPIVDRFEEGFYDA
jgi:hypothetical protein